MSPRSRRFGGPWLSSATGRGRGQLARGHHYGPAVTQLRVHRGWDTTGIIRRLEVVVDGVEVGKLRWRDSLTVSLAPGTHTVMVKMDWQASPPVTVVADEGVAELHLDVKQGFFLLALVRLFTQPKRAYALQPR